jgi:hypothetical protein
MLGGKQHDQQGGPVAAGVRAPTAAEDTFAVLPQNPEAALSPSAEPKG